MNFRIFATVLLLAVTAGTQTPTVTGNVTQALTVVAFGLPGSQQSVPVGPLPAAGASLSAVSQTSSASMLAAPTAGHPPGVAGFRFQNSGIGTLNFFAPGGYSTDGELVLDIAMPAPTPVLIVVSGTAQSLGASSSVRIDIDDDQTVEATLAVSTLSPSAAIDAEFGFVVGPGGRPIRILHAASGSALFTIVSANSDLTLTFYAGASPIGAYGPACIDLTWSRSANAGVTYACPAGSGSLAFFAFGLNAMQTALPFPPGCFQLTDVLVSIASVPSGGQATFAQPPLALPPGFSFNVQAAVFEAALGTVRTTNGLVMTGSS